MKHIFQQEQVYICLLRSRGGSRTEYLGGHLVGVISFNECGPTILRAKII